jgi:hypothetical protein
MNSTSIRPAPRSLPLSTRLVILFGGTLSGIGWILFAFGGAFVWIFAGNADWSSAFSFRGPLETAQATLTDNEQTHFSEGGGRHSRGTPIYAHHYTFYFDDTRYAGTSYSLGRGPRDGAIVAVEFPVGRPALSRIHGMRRAPFGPGVLFVFLFPIIGLGMIVPGLLTGRKGVRLLINGEVAEGRLISKQATNVKTNGRTVFKLTFEFKDSRGETRQAVARTEKPEKLEGDSPEPIFYDSQDPSCSVVLDNLPGEHAFTANGDFEPNGFWPATRALVLPCASVIVHAVFLYCRIA